MGEMQYFLSEADNRRIEESVVDNLVCGLRDALYDADDIIDLAKFEGSKLLVDNRLLSSRNTIKILNNRLKDISGDKSFWTLNTDTCLGKYSETNHKTSSHLVEPMLEGNHITISTAKLMDLVLDYSEVNLLIELLQCIGAHDARGETVEELQRWELLWKTMNIKEEKEVENLREVGFEIVKKCGSLPLAIRFVASVLETKEKTET
ncbi:hypothetical protein PR202_gb12917 [Eleusine coracana subsp. coracana]|uniref:Disease resistance N-terminal domain-containing protein n=1 Tax=Eleusine coracana subsp. coracana TaxID=191504 RepID=A0AAV5EQU9_ELECO|nr:hypothetical protein PR202_gb12917 [Eleusine coracana subsp. coracana]